MIDKTRLMEIFQYLSSQQGLVKLFNTYRGLPLDTDTVVYKAEDGSVTTGIFGYQAVSMALEGKTHMQLPRLPVTLRATVVEVDIKKKRAVLSDFTNTEGIVGHRTTVRVEPSETLDVTIYDGRQRLGGKIIDLSSEGMCVYTFFAQMYGLKFEHDREVFIDFRPPYSDTMIRSRGVITRITRQDGSNLHRLGLKIYPSPEIKPVLDEYILRRQKELMNEMEKSYLSLSRRKIRRA